MSYLEYSRMDVFERNRANWERLKDKLESIHGTRNLTVIGSKTREIKNSYDPEELVCVTHGDRSLMAFVAYPESGKTSTSGWVGFLRYLEGAPLIINDDKREYEPSRAPLRSSPAAVARIRALGFEPMGLWKMQRVSPYFQSGKDGKRCGVTFRSLFELDDEYRRDIFSLMFGEKDGVSSATSSGISFIYREMLKRPRFWNNPEHVNGFYKYYRKRMADMDAKSAAGQALQRIINDLLEGKFFEGEKIDLQKWFEAGNNQIILETSNIFSDDMRTAKFNLFFLALLYDLRRKPGRFVDGGILAPGEKGGRAIPRVMKITEEADLRLDHPLERKAIELELNKMRTEGNHNLFVVQNLEKLPSFMGAVDAIIVCNLGEKDRLMLRNFSGAENLRDVERLEYKKNVRPRQLGVVYKDRFEECYPFACPWEFPRQNIASRLQLTQ